MPFSTSAKQVMLDAIETDLADAAIVRLHTGDPGAAGTANTLAEGNGYAHLTGASFTRTGVTLASDKALVPGVRTGGGDQIITHVSVWKSGATPAFRMSAQLAAPVTYAVGGLPPGFDIGALSATITDPA
jgi:hypothetical protein